MFSPKKSTAKETGDAREQKTIIIKMNKILFIACFTQEHNKKYYNEHISGYEKASQKNILSLSPLWCH